jgi:putative ABC transport system permease protein
MTIISALEGLMGSMEKEIGRLGPQTFMVSKMMIATSEEMWLEKIKRKPINLASAKLIENGCQNCLKVSPRTFESQRAKYGSKSIRDVGIMGCMSSFIDIMDFEVAQGRFHSSEDDLHRRPVVFIGDGLREEFFPGVDPLGKEIKLGSKKYTVIGVAKKVGSFFGESRDEFAAMPLSTFSTQFGQPRWGLNVLVKAESVEKLDEAMDEVRMILRSQRGVPFNEPDDFDMLTAESFLDLLNQLTKMFRFALVGISSISMVVGGIVVMNIMMVAVTERTREIGIRKAIGAKQSHILLQFLFESLTLTIVGGLIGMVSGYLIAKMLVGMIGMEIEPSTLAVVAGLSISMGTGLIFGIYPAMKAARLDPIKALSYE